MKMRTGDMCIRALRVFVGKYLIQNVGQNLERNEGRSLHYDRQFFLGGVDKWGTKRKP